MRSFFIEDLFVPQEISQGQQPTIVCEFYLLLAALEGELLCQRVLLAHIFALLEIFRVF